MGVPALNSKAQFVKQMSNRYTHPSDVRQAPAPPQMEYDKQMF